MCGIPQPSTREAAAPSHSEPAGGEEPHSYRSRETCVTLVEHMLHRQQQKNIKCTISATGYKSVKNKQAKSNTNTSRAKEWLFIIIIIIIIIIILYYYNTIMNTCACVGLLWMVVAEAAGVGSVWHGGGGVACLNLMLHSGTHRKAPRSVALWQS